MIETYIVIVNYNKKFLLERAIDSLLDDGNKLKSIILVDNASNDGSPEFIKNKYPSIILIEIKKNAGWANATNTGIRKAMELGAKYVILCNDDIEVYTHDVVAKLINNLKIFAPKKLYLISPRIHSVDNIDEVQNIGGNIIRGKKGRPISKFLLPTMKLNKSIRTSECIMGAFMGVNLDVFKKTELLDEKMYLYMDETDLCYRTWLIGGMCAVDDNLILLHKGGTSIGKKSPFQLYYKTRNEVYFIRKHFRTIEKPHYLIYLLLKMKTISILKSLIHSNPNYKKFDLVNAQIQGILHGLINRTGKVH